MSSKSKSESTYSIGLTVKKAVDFLMKSILSVKTGKYDSLSTDHKKVFDNLYPHLARRERNANLFSQFSEALIFAATLFTGIHTVAAYLNLILFSALFNWIAVGCIFLGLSVVIGASIFTVLCIEKQRERILEEDGIQLMFDAYDELTTGKDELMESLSELDDYFEDLERSFRCDGETDEDLLKVLSEIKTWIKDSSGLLSDEAINIVKDGILMQRDSDESLIKKDESLSQVAKNVYGQLGGSEKNTKMKNKDAIQKLKHFKEGWRKLTKLPDNDDLISKIDYDYLYQDYVRNMDKIKTSIKSLRIFGDFLLSDDPILIDRRTKTLQRVSESLKDQVKYFKEKRSVMKKSLSADKIDLKVLVTSQRDFKTIDMIARDFKDPSLHKVQNQKKDNEDDDVDGDSMSIKKT
ncbi:MAG: hypothetical protein VX737_01895 [Pseudomonadota bacterium]|nr:hypothetical protein [Pseudomonadota bacterium]